MSSSKHSDVSRVGPKTFTIDNCVIVIQIQIVKIVKSVTTVIVKPVGTIVTIVTVMRVVVLLKYTIDWVALFVTYSPCANIGRGAFQRFLGVIWTYFYIHYLIGLDSDCTSLEEQSVKA